ncbi:MAG: hypothetical protein HY244_07365 [Rhizobiales bacterium]|nr:hypothetical protein [Hyphomicrobiales bacterium]
MDVVEIDRDRLEIEPIELRRGRGVVVRARRRRGRTARLVAVDDLLQRGANFVAKLTVSSDCWPSRISVRPASICCKASSHSSKNVCFN